MYSATQLETPGETSRDNDTQKLLEMYDKEFGLEIGSSRELEGNMREESRSRNESFVDGLFEEIAREYSEGKQLLSCGWKCFFSYSDRQEQDQTLDRGLDIENHDDFSSHGVLCQSYRRREENPEETQHYYPRLEKWFCAFNEIAKLFTKQKET